MTIGLMIASLEIGGAQRAILSLAAGLRREGFSVRLILLEDKRIMPLPGDAQMQAYLSKNTYVLSKKNWWRDRLSTLGKMIGLTVCIWKLKRMLREEKLSVMVSFLERANILNLIAVREIPRVISIRKHMEMALAEKTWLKAILIRIGYSLLLHRATVVVCNSRESAMSFEKLFPVKDTQVHAILNCASDDIFPGSMADDTVKGIGESGAQIVAMGRFKPAKGFVPLIRSFRLVANQFPSAELVIIGDGPDRRKLERMIRALKLDGRVRLPGFLGNPVSVLKQSLIFVCSSRSEGFPNALVEAMMLGLPVVAADCHSGPREILEPSTDPRRKATKLETASFGIIVPKMPLSDLGADFELQASEIALADGMIKLLNDDALRISYGALAKRRALEFAPDKMVSEWESLLVNITTVKHSP